MLIGLTFQTSIELLHAPVCGYFTPRKGHYHNVHRQLTWAAVFF